MFADDTALSHSNKNPNALQTIVQRDLDVLFHWFGANKLTVNPSKTKALFFDKSVTTATCDSRDQGLTSNNQTIEITNNLDYLGACIDKNLTFRNHLNECMQRANNKLFSSYLRSECF